MTNPPFHPPIPPELWDTIPPAAQAAVWAVIAQMQARIDELELRVVELQEQTAALQEQLGRNSRNSSQPPSSGPVGVKRRPPRKSSGRKRGGQPGHRRHERTLVPLDQVDELVDLRPRACRQCGHALAGDDPQPRRYQTAELPPVRPEVTEYRLHRLACSGCGCQTTAAPPGPVFGPRLQAVLSLLAGAYRLGKRQVQAAARDLLGLEISLGMISKLERRTAAALERPIEELREHIRTQPAGLDETGWRESGEKAWLWTATTKDATCFHIGATRGAKEVRSMLGEDFAQPITCDRWSAYRPFPVLQWCWAHLRRDFQAMIDRGGDAETIGALLLGYSDRLFHWRHTSQAGTLSRPEFLEHMDQLRENVRATLELGAACGCAATAATCRDLLAGEDRLWTFVRTEQVEPTNNRSERAMRHAVLWRKISGGTDSAAGSRFVERILSYVETCRQQGRNVLESLKDCCHAALSGVKPPSLVPSKPAAAPAA